MQIEKHLKTAVFPHGHVEYQNVHENQYQDLLNFGVDTTRFANMCLYNNMIIFASGNAVHAMNLESRAIMSFATPDFGGVCSVCQSRDGKLMAVGYASTNGGIIRIFTLEGESLDAILATPTYIIENVGQVAVETMEFNKTSNLLCAVSAAPDYNIYVYDYAAQTQLLLKSKCFTNQVLKIHFNKYSPDSLITGGKVHFKIWQMALTFTGSKLKGDIAKFGLLDASDTIAFLELPSGNYLSGQGTGELALWDQTAVLMIFTRKNGEKCHQGKIEWIYLDTKGAFLTPDMQATLDALGTPVPGDGWWDQDGEAVQQQKPQPLIVTGGSDGYLKFWSAHQIMQSQFIERETTSIFFEIDLVLEVYLGDGVCVRDAIFDPSYNYCILQDSGLGGFIRLELKTKQFERIYYGYGGSVKSISFINQITKQQMGVNDFVQFNNARSGLVASIGQSGVLFLHDVINKQLVQIVQTSSFKAVKCLFIQNGLGLAIIYEDGMLRIFSVLQDDLSEDQNDILNLIYVKKIFTCGLIDLAISPKGVISVLSELGEIFLFTTSICLVKREDSNQNKSQQKNVKLTSMAQEMMNVADNLQDNKKNNELIRRNARGRLGMTSNDISPIGSVNLQTFCKLSKHSDRSLKNLIWLNEDHFMCSICGCFESKDRLVVVKIPDAEEVIKYRFSHPEQALQSTLGKQQQNSMLSYDVSTLVTKYLLNVKILPQDLPDTTCETIAKIEYSVMTSKIAAMLPTKNQLDGITDVLRGFEEQQQPTQPNLNLEEGEEELDENGEPIPKKKKQRSGGPLEEDKKESILFDFQQISLQQSVGFTPLQDKQQMLTVLIRATVDNDIRNRAEAAMDNVRQRAEAAAGNGPPVPATSDDPAALMTTLAVAEVRATYRSQLLYIFDYTQILQSIEQGVKNIEPLMVAPLSTDKLIDIPLISKRDYDDDEFKVSNTQSVVISGKKPLFCGVFAEQKLDQWCGSGQGALEAIYKNNYCPTGALWVGWEGGIVQTLMYDSQDEFELFMNKSKKFYQIGLGQIVQNCGFCCFEAGFGGHIIGIGDNIGNLSLLSSNLFCKFLDLEKGQDPIRLGLCYKFAQDELWSNGTNSIQLNNVTFKDELFSLLPVGSPIDPNAINQLEVSIKDPESCNIASLPTIEEERLLALDAIDNKHGLDQKQQILAKIESLRERFEKLVKLNESQPPTRRLKMDELVPDLLTADVWLQREQDRAVQLIQLDLGSQFNGILQKIYKINEVLPQIQDQCFVRSFSIQSQQVHSFNCAPLPLDIDQQLCQILGVESLSQLEENVSNEKEEQEEIHDEENQLPKTDEQETTKTQRQGSLRSLRNLPKMQKSEKQMDGIKKIKAVRPIDKIIQQVMGTGKGDEDDFSDINNKKQRILMRAQAREARRLERKRLESGAPNPAAKGQADQLCIDMAKNNQGIFCLKTQDNYVSVLSKLMQENENIQLTDNREGKWMEFLFTVKGLFQAKQDFNERVKILFNTKIAIVQVVDEIVNQCKIISMEIKKILGTALSSNLDQYLFEEENLDKLISSIKLSQTEEVYIQKQILSKKWKQFVETSNLKQLYSENPKYCFQDLRCTLHQIFGKQDGLLLINQFINVAIADKIITSDDAKRLREMLDKDDVDLQRVIPNAVSKVSNDYQLDAEKAYELLHEVKAEKEEVEMEAGQQEVAQQQTKRKDVKTESKTVFVGGCGIVGRMLNEFLLAECDVGVIQQQPGFDPSKPLNLLQKLQVNPLYVNQSRYYVSILIYIRKLLMSNIIELRKSFDQNLHQLSQFEVQLQLDFCRIRIRIINLFQECEIHHLYITKDAASLGNLERCRQEHKDLCLQMDALEQQIIAKLTEAGGIFDKLAQLNQEFNANISADAPYKAKLQAFFNKKVKVVKQKKVIAEKVAENRTDGEHDDSEEEESSNLSGLSEDEGGDAEIDENDLSKDGIVLETFQFVCQLRDQKRIYDQQLTDIQTQAEQLKLQQNNLSKKEKGTIQAIETANRELNSFRSSKQKELNAIQTGVMITMMQYASLESYEIERTEYNPVITKKKEDEFGEEKPEELEAETRIEQVNIIKRELNDSLLLDVRALKRLMQRIETRKLELQQLDGIHQQILLEKKNLHQQEKEKQKELNELRKKLVGIQNLKFGREVDIAKLDGVVFNDQVIELQKVLDTEEKDFQILLDQKYLEYQSELNGLTGIIQKNSDLIQQLYQLEKEALELDKAIINRQKQPPKAWCSDNRQELVRQEYNNLKQAIVDRERELRSLVDEISLLKNHSQQ